MKLATKGRRALRALVRLAMSDDRLPVPLHRLAAVEDISRQYLETVFSQPNKANIVQSTRGPGGGFLLSRPPERIFVTEVLEAVEEPIDCPPCTEKTPDGRCRREGTRETCSMLSPPFEEVRRLFAERNLQDVLLVSGASEPAQSPDSEHSSP